MGTAPAQPARKVRPNIHFARVNTASFRGERGDTTLRVAPDIFVKPGVQLAEGCVIGKELGRGIQVSQILRPRLVLSCMRKRDAELIDDGHIADKVPVSEHSFSE